MNTYEAKQELRRQRLEARAARLGFKRLSLGLARLPDIEPRRSAT